MAVSIFSWVRTTLSLYFRRVSTPLTIQDKEKEAHPESPIDCGRRLILKIIDENARETPQHPFCSIPRTANIKDGFDEVSWLQLANSINQVAWWIEGNLGRSDRFEAIAYFGPNDIRYAIIMVAAQKTGYKVCFSSLWNDLETHVHLLESFDCKILVTNATPHAFVDDIMAQRPMKHLKMFETRDLLEKPLVDVYPYTKDFQQAQMEPLAIFHTSGSTGFPKPIGITNGTMAACDAYQRSQVLGCAPSQVEIFKGKRVYAALPPYHAAGMFHLLAIPTFYGSIAVLGPPVAPTAAVAIDVHEHGNVEISILRPDILAGITNVPGYLERLGRLDFVMNAACALPRHIGDKIAMKTSVTTYMGSTETMLVSLEMPNQEDWEYITPSDIMGIEFRHHHEDLYELFIVRDPRYEQCQAIFYTFPYLNEYSMKDLYSKHPTKPRLWRYRGRVDDVIQLSNGRKFLPAAMESAVASHPNVKTSLALGHARAKVALLLEPRDPSLLGDQTGLLESVWPTVDVANRAYPQYATVSRDCILFTTQAKPMLRTAKGTIRRMQMSKEYEKELDLVLGA